MKKLFITTILTLLISVSSFASHVMGGDITYTCLGNNVYEVTLTLYRDCAGGTIGTGTQTVNFTSSCGTQAVQLPFVSQTDVSQLCATAPSTCAGGANPGTEQFIFTGQVTLAPCADWTMYWSLCCRNNAITNLVNPSGESLYLQTTMNSVAANCNNSPQFLNMPTPYLCANNLAIYSHAASDIDGDSLYYSFNTPLTTPGPPGTPIAFAAGYSLPQPVITTSGMNFDQVTGEMCFTPSQGQICVISVLIEEFRNGVLIGTQIREMQVVIDPTCTNQNPTTGVAASCGGAATLTITQQGPTVQQTDANSVVMCPNDTVCFEVDFSDPDGDNITITSNVGNAIPNATFSVANNGTSNPIATFCWVPTPLDSGLNAFAMIATDDACPISGTQSFVFDVTVFDQPYAGPDQNICGTQGAQLNASGGAGYTWSVVSGDPIIVGTNFSCNPCTSPIATPAVTTTYVVTSSLSAACVNTDTVVVNVVPDITPTTYGDTLLCDFLSHQIGVNVNPAGVYTYDWTPPATLSNAAIDNPVASPTQTTTYYVEVASALGCIKTDSVTIEVNPPPGVTLVPDDTTICAGDVLQFDVSLTAINDDFTGGFDPVVWNNVSGASVGPPCVPFNGDALNFDAATRELSTMPANVSNCTSIDFCLWIANDAMGATACENADLNEDVELSYSTNGGATWTSIQIFTSGDWDAAGPYANSWQCFSIPIPAGAIGPSTMFQWAQIGPYGGTIDNWALDDIAIMCGGNTNYTYSWAPTTGLSDPNINNPLATVGTTTTYTVTLTDTAGCSVNHSQTITVVPNYNITSTQSDSSVCLQESVDFTVTPSGAGPYNYTWAPAGIMSNPNISNPTATFTTPGMNMITVLVDNGGGCMKADTFYVDVASVVTPNITILSPDTLLQCGDSTQVMLDLGGGIPAMCGPSATTACSGAATTSTVGVTSGANTSTSWPAPYGNWFSNAKHQFLYTAAELNAMGITGGKITDIAWEVTTLQGAGGNNGTYNNYDIKVGCTSTASLTAWETGLTQVYGPIDYTVVMGWNTHVFTTAYEWDGVSNLVVEICYDWIAPSTWSDNSITPWETTAFNSSMYFVSDGTVACPNATGTTSTNRPITRFSHCPTTPDPNAFDIVWTPNVDITTSTSQNPEVYPSVPTAYIVTVSDTAGNCFDNDTINIDVSCNTCYAPNPTITNVTCKDGTDGQIIIDPVFVMGSEIQNFVWTDSTSGAVLQTTNNITAGMQDTLNNLPAGTYIITMTDTSGCIADTIVTVTEPDSVLISSITTDDIVCIGGNKQIDATATGGNGNPYTYGWTDLSTMATIPGNGPHTVSPVINTCYSVYAEDPMGCMSDTQQVCISLYPNLIASTTDDSITVCPGDVANLDISAIGGNPNAVDTYNWYQNNNLIGSGSTINVTPTSSPTTYIGVATENCTTPADSVTIYVDWFNLPSLDFSRVSPNDSCYPITVELTNDATPSALIQSTRWFISDGSTLNGNVVNHPFQTPVCHDVTMQVTTTDDCVLDTTKVNYVCPHPYPDANFYMNPPITDVLNTEIDFTNLSTGDGLTYLWNFGSGLVPDTSVADNPSFIYPDEAPGVYPVMLTVTNMYGCVDTISGTVIVNDIYLFYIPNSFTPDGDGNNEFFRPYGNGIDLSVYTLQIFNRWGELLYEGNAADEKGWDGTYKGNPVKVDTYVWRVIAKEAGNSIIHKNNGHVNLIR